MSNHSKIPLLIAILAGTGALVFGKLYLKKYEERLSGGERVPLLEVIRDLEKGAVIREQDLAVRNVPSSYVDDGDVPAADLQRIVGLETAHPLRAQQGLVWSNLAIERDARQVSHLILPGKRAVPIRPNTINNTAGQIVRPGDYVDVIATFRSEKGELSSLVLLQRILVLALGDKTERTPTDKGGQRFRRSEMMTLSLDIQEAQLISIAQSRGELSIALRNPGDRRIQSDAPQLSANSITDARKQVVRRARRRIPKKEDSSPQKLREHFQ